MRQMKTLIRPSSSTAHITQAPAIRPKAPLARATLSTFALSSIPTSAAALPASLSSISTNVGKVLSEAPAAVVNTLSDMSATNAGLLAFPLIVGGVNYIAQQWKGKGVLNRELFETIGTGMASLPFLFTVNDAIFATLKNLNRISSGWHAAALLTSLGAGIATNIALAGAGLRVSKFMQKHVVEEQPEIIEAPTGTRSLAETLASDPNGSVHQAIELLEERLTTPLGQKLCNYLGINPQRIDLRSELADLRTLPGLSKGSSPLLAQAEYDRYNHIMYLGTSSPMPAALAHELLHALERTAMMKQMTIADLQVALEKSRPHLTSLGPVGPLAASVVEAYLADNPTDSDGAYSTIIPHEVRQNGVALIVIAGHAHHPMIDEAVGSAFDMQMGSKTRKITRRIGYKAFLPAAHYLYAPAAFAGGMSSVSRLTRSFLAYGNTKYLERVVLTSDGPIAARLADAT